jgi:hypothetical protein
MLKTLKLAAGVACLVTLLVGVNLWGQGIFATLTGVVTDPSQSVVPGAKITLTDTASGSTRDTVTNPRVTCNPASGLKMRATL